MLIKCCHHGSRPAATDLTTLAELVRRCQSGKMRPSLFEFAGGKRALLSLAAAHHARCLADPELHHRFSHDDLNPRHVERLAAYWVEVLGGPPGYSNKYSDHGQMLGLHAGNGDMADLGRRFVDCFVAAPRRRPPAG